MGPKKAGRSGNSHSIGNGTGSAYLIDERFCLPSLGNRPLSKLYSSRADIAGPPE
jgi:hypothetical protein